MLESPGVRPYIEQLVKVAGKGNLTVEFALHVDRMQLHCKSCDVSMTSHVPDRSDKIDYSIQNFIALHGHNGGHNDPKKFEEDWGKVTAVTADFKKVPLNGGFGYVPLPPSANVILKNVQPPYVTWEEQSGTYGTASQPVKVKKKDKPLKIATGRKFR